MQAYPFELQRLRSDSRKTPTSVIFYRYTVTMLQVAFTEIDDANFEVALWIFLQQLSLKLWVQYILLFSYKRLCTLHSGIRV